MKQWPMREPHEKTSQFTNIVSQFKNDFLMYNQYNLETTENIVVSLNWMMRDSLH